MVNSKPVWYSKHCQTPKIESFVKNSFLAHFANSVLKIFPYRNFLKKPALKKFIIFSQKKLCLIFLKWNPAIFGLCLQKIFPKKPALKKIFYIFSKKALTWKQKPRKKSLYFRKRNFLILQETELSYTSGNGTFLCFVKGLFRTLVYSEPWHV